MANPYVDGYAETLNPRKIIRKTQKNNNLLKSKRMLKPKYHLRWRSSFHIWIARRGISRLCLSSVTSLAMIYSFCIQ